MKGREGKEFRAGLGCKGGGVKEVIRLAGYSVGSVVSKAIQVNPVK